MNQTTKKQHYIWRNYLAPWTVNNSNTGRIVCLRDNKIFPVSLMKVAHENYFYGVKRLSKLERKIIYEMTIKNTKGAQRTANEGWLNLYCAPFDFVDEMTSIGYSMWGHIEKAEIEKNQEFKDWNIEYIEKLHGQIESKGIPYIALLRQNNLSFWQNESDRDVFSFFLANQYFRTKNTRDRILKVFEKSKIQSAFFENIRPENMWLPLSLIFASNTGAHIAHNFSAVLMQAKDSCFIVGDQPVVNTYSTFDMLTTPKDMEFFYPLTPHSALLLTKSRQYKNGESIQIGAEEVAAYNKLEKCAVREMLFAKEKEHLEPFIILA